MIASNDALFEPRLYDRRKLLDRRRGVHGGFWIQQRFFDIQNGVGVEYDTRSFVIVRPTQQFGEHPHQHVVRLHVRFAIHRGVHGVEILVETLV